MLTFKAVYILACFFVKYGQLSLALQQTTALGQMNCLLTPLTKRMKKLFVACAAMLLFSAAAQAQFLHFSNWNKGQRDLFLMECYANVENEMSQEESILYCNCMLDQLVGDYPNFENAPEFTRTNLESYNTYCLKYEGWGTDEVDAFMEQCVDEAEDKEGMDTDEALGHCGCMVTTLQNQFTSLEDARADDNLVRAIADDCQ